MSRFVPSLKETDLSVAQPQNAARRLCLCSPRLYGVFTLGIALIPRPLLLLVKWMSQNPEQATRRSRVGLCPLRSDGVVNFQVVAFARTVSMFS